MIITTPIWVDKTCAFVADATHAIGTAAKVTGRFVVANAPALMLGAGVLINVGAAIFTAIWTKKTEQERVWSKDGDAESKALKRQRIGWAITAGLLAVGNGLSIGSFLLKQREVNALTKALAAATNALPVVALGANQPGDGEPTDAIGVAETDFTIPVDESNIVPVLSETDPYGEVLCMKNAIDRFKMKLGPRSNGVCWNDFCRAIRCDKKQDTPYGWGIGFKSMDKMNAYLISPEGQVMDTQQALRRMVVDSGVGWKWGFSGLEDLTGGVKFILRGAKAS